MFRGLINDAKAAAGSLIVKYVAGLRGGPLHQIALVSEIAASRFPFDLFGNINAALMVAAASLARLVARGRKVKEQEEK